MDQDPKRNAGPDPDRRLDVEIAFDDPLAGAIGVRLGRFPKRPNEVGLTIAKRELGADAEQGRQTDATKQAPSVEINPVCDPRIARSIGGRKIVELDRRAIRKDDALPDEQRPALAEGHQANSDHGR